MKTKAVFVCDNEDGKKYITFFENIIECLTENERGIYFGDIFSSNEIIKNKDLHIKRRSGFISVPTIDPGIYKIEDDLLENAYWYVGKEYVEKFIEENLTELL